jgi:hypothetical protein
MRAEALRRLDDMGAAGRKEFLVCTAYTRNYTIGKLCAPINKAYCHQHGYHWIEESEYEYEAMLSAISPRSNCSWYKILLLKSLMCRLLAGEQLTQLPAVDSTKIRYLMWIDADAVIVNSKRTLESIVEYSKAMELIISEDMNSTCRINAGIFLLKVCPWSLSLLEEVWMSERYFQVAHFDQAALERHLRLLLEGLEDKYDPFHSFIQGGTRGLKFFAHTCVLESRDFNTNISDDMDCSLVDRGSLARKEGVKLSKRQRKLRRRLSRDCETREALSISPSDVGEDGLSIYVDSRYFAQFAFHVAGRRHKVDVLLGMLRSRGIPVPSELDHDELLQFSARPYYKQSPGCSMQKELTSDINDLLATSSIGISSKDDETQV